MQMKCAAGRDRIEKGKPDGAPVPAPQHIVFPPQKVAEATSAFITAMDAYVVGVACRLLELLH
jgi:hypothetical protein